MPLGVPPGPPAPLSFSVFSYNFARAGPPRGAAVGERGASEPQAQAQGGTRGDRARSLTLSSRAEAPQMESLNFFAGRGVL